MKGRHGVFNLAGALIVGAVIVWGAAYLQGQDRTYEVRPEIRSPEYRTDAARAIDAYERLMDRYLSLNEKSASSLHGDLKDMNRRLDGIGRQLDSLSTRMAGIERALGIEPVKATSVMPHDVNAAPSQGQTTTLPSSPRAQP